MRLMHVRGGNKYNRDVCPTVVFSCGQAGTWNTSEINHIYIKNISSCAKVSLWERN